MNIFVNNTCHSNELFGKFFAYCFSSFFACVCSTVNGGRYGYASGTSMACPHVSGVAAVVWANKLSLTNVDVRNFLMQGQLKENE